MKPILFLAFLFAQDALANKRFDCEQLLVRVGSQMIERAPDEVFIVGEAVWQEYTRVQLVIDRRTGRNSRLDIVPVLQLVIYSQAKSRMVNYGDRVLLVNSKGNVFHDEIIEGPMSIVGWTNMLDEAVTAAVVYRSPSSEK